MIFIKVLIAATFATVSTLSFANTTDTWCPSVALLASTYQDNMKKIQFNVNHKTITFIPTWTGYVNHSPGKKTTSSIKKAHPLCGAFVTRQDNCSIAIKGSQDMLSNLSGPVSKSNTCVYQHPEPFIMQLTLDRTKK